MASRKVGYRLAFAIRAGDTIGPAKLGHESCASLFVGEILDCFLQRLGEVVGLVHYVLNIAQCCMVSQVYYYPKKDYRVWFR